MLVHHLQFKTSNQHNIQKVRLELASATGVPVSEKERDRLFKKGTFNHAILLRNEPVSQPPYLTTLHAYILMHTSSRKLQGICTTVHWNTILCLNEASSLLDNVTVLNIVNQMGKYWITNKQQDNSFFFYTVTHVLSGLDCKSLRSVHAHPSSHLYIQCFNQQ